MKKTIVLLIALIFFSVFVNSVGWEGKFSVKEKGTDVTFPTDLDDPQLNHLFKIKITDFQSAEWWQYITQIIGYFQPGMKGKVFVKGLDGTFVELDCRTAPGTNEFIIQSGEDIVCELDDVFVRSDYGYTSLGFIKTDFGKSVGDDPRIVKITVQTVSSAGANFKVEVDSGFLTKAKSALEFRDRQIGDDEISIQSSSVRSFEINTDFTKLNNDILLYDPPGSFNLVKDNEVTKNGFVITKDSSIIYVLDAYYSSKDLRYYFAQMSPTAKASKSLFSTWETLVGFYNAKDTWGHSEKGILTKTQITRLGLPTLPNNFTSRYYVLPFKTTEFENFGIVTTYKAISRAKDSEPIYLVFDYVALVPKNLIEAVLQSSVSVSGYLIADVPDLSVYSSKGITIQDYVNSITIKDETSTVIASGKDGSVLYHANPDNSGNPGIVINNLKYGQTYSITIDLSTYDLTPLSGEIEIDEEGTEKDLIIGELK